MKKILVDGLAWSTTDDELVDLFSTHGEVAAAVVIRDHVTGQSRGYGFVEMERSSAERAVAALNGQEFNSRRLIVALAKERLTA
jgi:RNA recognition motif-containing protein